MALPPLSTGEYNSKLHLIKKMLNFAIPVIHFFTTHRGIPIFFSCNFVVTSPPSTTQSQRVSAYVLQPGVPKTMGT